MNYKVVLVVFSIFYEQYDLTISLNNVRMGYYPKGLPCPS